MTPTPAETVQLVPLADLVKLATIVAAMRRAQRAYFDAKKRFPMVPPDAEWREARAAEKRCDAAVADALTRDRQSLPGMG